MTEEQLDALIDLIRAVITDEVDTEVISGQSSKWSRNEIKKFRAELLRLMNKAKPKEASDD